MLDTIFGLPVHPLLVHATVVLVPLAAVVVALAALWPRFRAWAGYLPLGVSALALLLVPLSTSSGESLEERVPETALVERHAELAEGLLPWVIVLGVGALALLIVHLREKSSTLEPLSRAILAGLMVLAVVGSVGSVVQVGRIGHAGAEASWSGEASTP